MPYCNIGNDFDRHNDFLHHRSTMAELGIADKSSPTHWSSLFLFRLLPHFKSEFLSNVPTVPSVQNVTGTMSILNDFPAVQINCLNNGVYMPSMSFSSVKNKAYIMPFLLNTIYRRGLDVV